MAKVYKFMIYFGSGGFCVFGSGIYSSYCKKGF